jgi:hypothetical protein
VTPCRVLDTRNGEGQFGGPSLSAGSIRLIPMMASQCNIPTSAASFAVNVTIVPERKLNFLTIYPAGNSLPNVSLVNSVDGRTKAIAAIVAAGASGSIAAFATDSTQLIIDINGYFVPPSVAIGLRFFPMKPCRVFDTRSQGSSNGGVLEAGEQREFRVLTSPCGIPSNARAYSLNYTAVPREKKLRWVSAWPAGNPMPSTSTLNAPTGAVTANGSITPAGTNGDISIYVTDRTDLIADINGYFAPDGTGGLLLYNTNPCRMLDSRVTDTPSQSLGTMLLDFGGSACGIPATASAALTNITAVPMERLEFLSVGPPAWDLKSSSLLNAYDGEIASNVALVPLAGGYADAYTTNRTHLIVDVFGYFAP